MLENKKSEIISPESRVRLRVLSTTDLHARLYPYDYYTAQPDHSVGLIRTATLIKENRRGVDNCLLVDGGDFLNGSALSDYVAAAPELETNPIIDVMNAIGYDVVTVGNHEFNYGLEALESALSKAGFPVVSSNLKPVGGRGVLQEYVILARDVIDETGEKHRLKIGFVGFAPPQIVLWDSMQLHGLLQAQDIVESARHIVPKVKSAGADIVIALAHTGIIESRGEKNLENAACQLSKVQGIDAIVAGHQHRIFPGKHFRNLPLVDADKGTLNDVPTVMAGFCGSHLGVLDLVLTRKSEKWQVCDHHVATPAIARRTKNGEVRPLVANDYQATSAARKGHQRALAYSNRIVGTLAQGLNNYFSMVGYDLSLQFVLQAQRNEILNHIKGTEFDQLPVLAASAPLRCGGFGGPRFYTQLDAGVVSLRNIFDLYSFPDEICAVKVTGAQIRDWLERSAGFFNRIQIGKQDQALVNPDHPSYYHDTILGVSCEVDLSQPARFDSHGTLINQCHRRISALNFKGRPINPDQEFLVATNDFRAFGGGRFAEISEKNVVVETHKKVRESLIEFLNASSGATVQNVLSWRFKPMKNTSVIFESGVKSGAYIADIPELDIEQAQNTVGGFCAYRLNL